MIIIILTLGKNMILGKGTMHFHFSLSFKFHYFPRKLTISYQSITVTAMKITMLFSICGCPARTKTLSSSVRKVRGGNTWIKVFFFQLPWCKTAREFWATYILILVKLLCEELSCFNFRLTIHLLQSRQHSYCFLRKYPGGSHAKCHFHKTTHEIQIVAVKWHFLKGKTWVFHKY